MRDSFSVPAMAPYSSSSPTAQRREEPSRGQPQRSPRRGNRIQVVRSPPRQQQNQASYRPPEPPMSTEVSAPAVYRPPEAPISSPPLHPPQRSAPTPQQTSPQQQQQSIPASAPLSPPTIQAASASCPPLNLEFLWKLSVKRKLKAPEIDERIRILEQQGFPRGLAKCVTQW
jgi:hypothetical protein